MKTNKANFKKKADSITSMPSNNAWEQLEAKLDQPKTKKKSIRLFPLLAIAASFLLLFGVFFVNNFFDKPDANMAKASILGDGQVEQIAIVYKEVGVFQDFYESVAAQRKFGILKKY